MKRKYYKIETKQGYAGMHTDYSCISRKGSKQNLETAYNELKRHYGKHMPLNRLESFIERWDEVYEIYLREE